MTESEVDEDSALCRRCESIDIKKFWYHTMIDRKSLRKDCASCIALSRYFPRYFPKDQIAIPADGLSRYSPRHENAIWPTLNLYIENFEVYSDRSRMAFVTLREVPFEDRPRLLVPEASLAQLNGIREHGSVAQVALADLNRARIWIDECRFGHKPSGKDPRYTCATQPVRTRTSLRIIDCATLEVRKLKSKEIYVCLSYVWGSSATAKPLIEQKLDYSAIPKTIADAIHVASKLGIPQLWVDQYCIDQEDAAARHDAISSMNLIYGGAEVTIVATSGSDASSGLPGVLGTERKSPILRPVTLGRQILCEIDDPVRQVFPQRGIGLWADAIFDRISEYFPRELTHASDILRAVEGILEAFDGERMGDIRARHFYGIPLQYDVRDSQSKEFSIARGLAWRVKAFVHHGRAKFEDWEISQDANMPSWTWASRKSARQLHEKDVRLEFDGSQGEKAPGVRYRITNRDGKVISLRQFAISPLPGHYLKFFPWIDVTSWVIHGRLTIDPADPGKILVFAGVDKADLHLDDNHVTAGDQTTAFFLSFVERHATPYHAPLYLAQSKGYFKDEGIKVALLEPNDPSARATSSLSDDVTELIGSGKVDLGFKAMIHTLAASARGFPVQSIGSLLNEPFTGVVYLASSGITPDFTTLKGKKIGYVGEFGKIQLDELTAHYGMAPTDYEAVRVGMNVTRSIITGEIDAGIGLENVQMVELEEWLVSQNRARDDDVRMLRIDELAQLGCCCFCSILYIANNAFVQQQPQKVAAFLRACKRATDFVLAEPDQAWAELCAFKTAMDTPTNRKIFERSFAYFSPDLQNVKRDWDKVTRYGKRLGVLGEGFVPNYTNDYLTWGLEEEAHDPTGDQKRMVALQEGVKQNGGFKRLETVAGKTVVGAAAPAST
ncbi:NMT1-domain-containing protein [Stemphylium lycopersici]|nr:N-myristoyltransferase 1 [Stemphylium lycopersici]RAR00016.1 NMT1-domain-containing protein [Stemphylium lycopersici]